MEHTIQLFLLILKENFFAIKILLFCTFILYMSISKTINESIGKFFTRITIILFYFIRSLNKLFFLYICNFNSELHEYTRIEALRKFFISLNKLLYLLKYVQLHSKIFDCKTYNSFQTNGKVQFLSRLTSGQRFYNLFIFQGVVYFQCLVASISRQVCSTHY